jgi:Outer membrane protein beta-barrel domain
MKQHAVTHIALLSFSSLALVTMASTASAADSGIYFGGGIVHSTIDTASTTFANPPSTADLSDSDNGYKVIVGVRPLDWFAIEANYIDLGKINASTPSAHAEYGLKGIDAFGVLLFGVPFVDLYAKAGVIQWQADGGITAVSNIPLSSDSGFDVAYGAGAQARLGSLAIRLEYEQFKIKDTDNVAAVTLGVTWTFL